jgi:hypothetical protein
MPSFVIPAKAGIQSEVVNPVFLDFGLRRNDGKTKLVSDV